jgi:hypothetical protein
MTPRQADKLIKSGERVTLRSINFNQSCVATVTGRDRYNINLTIHSYTDAKSGDWVQHEHTAIVDRGGMEITS